MRGGQPDWATLSDHLPFPPSGTPTEFLSERVLKLGRADAGSNAAIGLSFGDYVFIGNILRAGLIYPATSEAAAIVAMDACMLGELR
jgi:hypothetical protein